MSALTLSLKDRRRAALSLLHRPIAYTICAPLMTAAGAATTIAAPRLLTPSSFAQFALLASVIQYAAEFDLGLGRMTDRELSSRICPPELMGSLMLARFWLALGLTLIVLMTSPFTGVLTSLAAAAGIAIMLCNGPLAFFRAQSKLAAFTLSSILIQAGLSAPRLMGLLVDGVAGCVLALAIWNAASALILTVPLIPRLRYRLSSMPALPLFAQSAPLFVFSSSWQLFLLANRWFAWLLLSPTETGLFAFGANLVGIGIGLVNMVAQAYYPRHLIASKPAALARELWCLLALSSVGGQGVSILSNLGLARLFPHFTGAEASTVALLTTATPLSLCAWLIPLMIARSRSPVRDAAAMFGTSLIALFAGMWLGRLAGIDGLAWGCLPSSLGLLGLQLKLASHYGLVERSAAVTLWFASVAVSAGCWGFWLIML